MKIWAIADPHFGFGADKMMDIFGSHWDGHADAIARAWRERVSAEDAVILAGDISWAINYDELLPDYELLNSLPGRKYIGRGNHDYWWVSLAKNKAFCERHGFTGFEFLRNNAFLLPLEEGGTMGDGLIICGTRGWITPFHADWKQSDEKYFRREEIRLKLALDAAKKLKKNEEPIVLAMHYPPFGPNGESTDFTEMIALYGVRLCLFGHLHGMKGRALREQSIDGVLYLNTASDVLDFQPLDVGEALAMAARYE